MAIGRPVGGNYNPPSAPDPPATRGSSCHGHVQARSQPWFPFTMSLTSVSTLSSCLWCGGEPHMQASMAALHLLEHAKSQLTPKQLAEGLHAVASHTNVPEPTPSDPLTASVVRAATAAAVGAGGVGGAGAAANPAQPNGAAEPDRLFAVPAAVARLRQVTTVGGIPMICRACKAAADNTPVGVRPCCTCTGAACGRESSLAGVLTGGHRWDAAGLLAVRAVPRQAILSPKLVDVDVGAVGGVGDHAAQGDHRAARRGDDTACKRPEECHHRVELCAGRDRR